MFPALHVTFTGVIAAANGLTVKLTEETALQPPLTPAKLYVYVPGKVGVTIAVFPFTDVTPLPARPVQVYVYDWFGVGFVFVAVNVTAEPMQIVALLIAAKIPSAIATVTVTAVREDSHPVVVFTSAT